MYRGLKSVGAATLLLGSAGSTPSAVAAPPLLPHVAPLCPASSHDRLTIREGRDVCASTLSSSGRAVANGYLPTICPRARPDYHIDFSGLADRCLRSSSNQGN
jgi:hypothetical protein